MPAARTLSATSRLSSSLRSSPASIPPRPRAPPCSPLAGATRGVGPRSASTTSSFPPRLAPPSPAPRRRREHPGRRAPTPSPSRSPPTRAPSRASASPAPPSAPASPPRRPGSVTSRPATAAPARSRSSARPSGATARSPTHSSPPPRSRPSPSASAASPTPGPPPPPRPASRTSPFLAPTSPRLHSRACYLAAPRCVTSGSGTSRDPARRIRITSCRSLVLFGVWQYKHLEELTVEDAPRLECLLGDVHLGASVTIIGAPKLTALGYLVVGFRGFLHGIDKPAVEEKVNKGLRAPFNSVKILAISMTFSSKKNMETLMNLLKCFPLLETLHIQGKPGERQVDTIDFGYYQKNEPIGCIVNHLKTVRLESKVKDLIIEVERNMFEFVCFLLVNAQVLQIMKIQSAMSDTPAWTTEQQNLIQCHRASVEAKVVFEGLKVVHHKGFSIEAVNALPDPFDSDIDIMGY